MLIPTVRRGLPLLPLLLLAGSPALAHGTASGGLGAGVLHPLLGFDHLLLLIAMGASAACLSPMVLLWAAAGALLGAVGGAAGASLPAAEVLAALAVSLVALPLLSRHPQRWQAVAGMPLAAAVAVHALLHGQEAPAGAAAPLWWLGALGASLLVIGLANAVVRQLPHRGRAALGLALASLGRALAMAQALAPVAG